MKEKLNIYTLTKKDNNFILEISSTAKKIVLAKNATGDSTNFKKTILII